MPTKPNRAGDQQNYVPQGNGDASGEYADNESGSNTHFKNFKKPDDNNNSKNKFTNFKKVLSGNDEGIEIKPSDDKQTNFEDFVKNNFAAKDGKLNAFGSNLTDSFNTGTDDAKNLINVAIGSGVKIRNTKGTSCYSGVVELNTYQGGDSGFYRKGEILYHEFWHCFDNIYAAGIVNDKIKSLLTEEDRAHIAASGGKYFSDLINKGIMLQDLSTSKVLSNGKTLFETWKDECRRRTLNRKNGEGWEKITSDYKKELDDELLKKHPDYFEIKTQLMDLRNKILEDGRKKFPLPQNGDITLLTQRSNNISKYVEDEKHKPEFVELEAKYKAMMEERDLIERKSRNYWAPISDAYGIYNKVSYGFCGGHAGNYGSKLIGAGAKEFMAEYGSARSRSDEGAKQQLEKLKKYFPETSKMCEELQDIIIKYSKKIGVK